MEIASEVKKAALLPPEDERAKLASDALGSLPSVLYEGDNKELNQAIALGIDVGLIEENLSLTPLERMRQHDECVRQVLAARERLVILEDEDA